MRLKTSSLNLRSHNMAFVSTLGSTNEVDTANIQVSTGITPISTASHKDNLEQIHKDDREEMDLKWQLVLLSMRAGRDILIKDSDMAVLNSKLEKISKEKDAIDFKIEKFENASQSLDKLIGSQITMNNGEDEVKSPPEIERKTVNPSVDKVEVDKSKQNEKITRRPVKYVEMYRKQRPMSNQRNWNNLKSQQLGSNFVIHNKACYACGSFNHLHARCKYHQRERMVNGINHSRVNHSANTTPKAVLTRFGLKPINSARHVNPKRSSQGRTTYNNKNFFQQVNTAKGKVNTARPNSAVLNAVRANKGKAGHLQKQLEDQGEELKVMCDKNNSVLFTNTDYFVLSPDFMLADENHVLLKVPRKKNMYSVDMKNIVHKKDLTCLVAKATNEESKIWYRKILLENRVLVVKPYFKTPYELFRGRAPALSFMRPTTLDNHELNSDDNNKDNYGPCQECKGVNQETPNAQNSTNNINTDGSSINNASSNIKTIGPTVNVRQSNDFFGAENDMLHLDEVVVDINNVFTTYFVPTTPNTRIHKDHSLDNVIGDIQSGVQTRRMTVTTNQQGFLGAIYEDLHTCLFACFLSQEEPKRIINALKDPAWVEAMQEELLQFHLQKVWILVDLPRGKRAIGTRWVFRNKKDDRGIVIRNKARLVTQGFTQEEGIDYEEVFAPVARIKSIRLFLAYASFMGFLVYQMALRVLFYMEGLKKRFMYVNLYGGESL
ncbi:ribonuclease H-like domain-containing protein [Tanacetum coccineum]